MYRVYLLGRFYVEREELPIPETAWSRPKAKKLLKLLALQPDHQLHKEQVMEWLWPDLAVTAARDNLYRTLHRLRRALDPDGSRSAETHSITLDEGLLRLVPAEAWWVDAEAFAALVNQARTVEKPIPLLEAARQLYTGDLLPEELYEEWTLAARDRLRRIFSELLLRLATAYRQAAQIEAALGCLRQLLEYDPADETAHRELMLTYALAGQRSEALRQYELCVQALAAELGVEPAPETTILYQQIVAGEIEARQSTGQLPAEPTGLIQGNLPIPATPLIGREWEVTEVCRLLKQPTPEVRLLTLTGPGGVGKTRLALQAVAELQAGFAAGVRFIPLASIRDPELVLSTLAQSLGVPEVGGQPLLPRLKAYLRDKSMLLLIDNLEHLLAAAPLLAELLAAAPGLKLLLTSRSVLHIYGEYEFVVPPLQLPDPGRLPPLDLLAQVAAVALFVQRTQAVRPNFVLTAGNAPVVAAICIGLDGLPLAIELAAAHSKFFSPPALLGRLEKRLAFLTGGPHDLPARHQTLRDTIAWSYELLEPDERTLFRRLGIFAGGWTVEAARAIAGPVSTLAGLTSLVNKSLIKASEVREEMRFMMLETLREYALEQLVAQAELEASRRQYALYFLELAQAAEPKLFGTEQELWLERLEAEHDNLRAALTWSQGTEDDAEAEIGLKLAGILFVFWHLRGYWSEGRSWMAAALQRSSEAAPPLRGKALYGAGLLAWAQEDLEAAQALLEQSLVFLPAGNGAYDRGHALGIMGLVKLYQGYFAEAEPFLTESLALFQGQEDRWGIAISLIRLGIVAQFRQAWAQATELCTESLALFRELDNAWGIALSLGTLAEVALAQGEWSQAGHLYQESLEYMRLTGSAWYIALILVGLAGVAVAEGQAEQAAQLLGAGAALLQTVGGHLPPIDRRVYERNMAAARAQLGEEAFSAAWSKGQAMTLEQALASLVDYRSGWPRTR